LPHRPEARAAVPTDELHRRVSLQPGGKRLSTCVSQQIDGHALFQIYQQRPIALTFAPGPFIDPDYFDWGRWREGAMPKQAQDGRGTTRHPLLPGSDGLPPHRLSLLQVFVGSPASETFVVRRVRGSWARVLQRSCVGRHDWSSENGGPGEPTRSAARLRADPLGNGCNSCALAMRLVGSRDNKRSRT
jgi:hypothetical protein